LEFGSDLLAGFSIVTGVLLHEYLVACIVVLMLSGGSALEVYATRHASALLGALAKRMPKTAHLIKDLKMKDVSVEQIVAGDRLVVLPHEICPVDGEVVEGHGDMDESYLTGEPFDISKVPGSAVLSGAVNGDAALRICATRVSSESRYARIVKVVEDAERKRPPMRRVADRLGAWYTPLALAIAGAAWIASGTPERFLAVLVIATPCPLLIAIPVVIIGGISLAAKRGIVIKNPEVLEQLDRCRTFIFDKTGTLTYGRPVLADIVCVGKFDELGVLRVAASLEQYSRHPLALAILDSAKTRKVALSEVSNVSERPGEGLSGTIGDVSIQITGRNKILEQDSILAMSLPPAISGLECLILINGELAAVLRFHDAPREESRPFVRHLGRMHNATKVILLSGDRQIEVEHLASLVGIKEVYFGKFPEEKVALVGDETKRAKTLFVGDGINDAPAMLTATVGIALGQNSDVTSEAAQAIVLDSSLRKVDELIHIARRVRLIALQSAVGGILISSFGMLIAAFGWLPPIGGAIAQEVIDLAAVLNALRVTIPPRQLSDF
jgi:heavy metal translocating P-type ATPase